MALETEMLLKGRYKIGNKLGENAIGETYDAMDSESDKKVVVKEIRQAKIVGLYESLKTCGNLDGIVDILDVFSEGNASYAVMEYVAGVTLEDYLTKNNAKFNMQRIKDLLNPVICSLIRLGEEGISHGNISADNIIFTNQGKLKLIGFGHVNGVVSGMARPYAPVEMYGDVAEASEVSDIYSISTFIYRCITGVVPAEAAQRKANETCVKPIAMGIVMDKSDESAIWMGMNVDADKRLMKLSAFYRALYNKQAAAQPQIQPQVQPQVQVQPQPQSQVQSQADDRTEIINNNNIPKAAPINTELNTQKSKKPKKKSKKKKGSPILIILIIVGIIVAVVLGVVTYKLATDYYGEDESTSIFGKSGDNKDSESESSDEAVDVISNIEGLVNDGNYEDAIQALIDNEVEKDDGAKLLQQAIDELYSQCVNETNALANMGDFDTAYSTVENRTQYFADVASKLDYAEDIHEYDLADLKYGLESKMVDYLYSNAEKAANADDETAMLDAFNQLSGKVADDELESEKESAYTKLVLAHMVNMSSSNSSAYDIRQYLEDNLSNTGNNCRIMEFWNYYDDLYYKQLGKSRMQVTSVRTSGAGYILPNSSISELNYSDINSLSQYELYFALYEIYARHGRMFTDTVVSDQFNKFSWYNATISPETFDESVLSDIEKKNIETIISYERAMGYR